MEFQVKRIALGLSGGVDSAVAAHLLKQQGYEVHCIYLNCFDEDVPGLRPRGVSGPSTVKSSGLNSPRGCRTKQDRKDALAVALHLKLPFQVLDFRKEYQSSVIDYFKREYEAGRTPNPDVVCNRDIKFGLFYQWAISQQHFDFMATGHYARLARGTRHEARDDVSNRERFTLHASRFTLSRPLDEHKDQTYFLWQVPRERFSRVLFPLGNYLKSDVRQIARDAKLPVAEKKDSTGICFIGEVRVEDFLKKLGVKEHTGEVVDTSGHVIGKHWGVTFYTIGQRHGFEINPKSEIRNPKQSNQNSNDQHSKHLEHSDLENSNLFRASNLDIRVSPQNRPPLYVIEKDVAHNRLIVGFGAECYRSQFNVSEGNWLVPEKVRPFGIKRSDLHTIDCLVRIRHGGELIPCYLEKVRPWRMPWSDLHTINVFLSEPQRGLAVGQSAVFYSEDGIVLGGGVIECEGSDPSHWEQGLLLVQCER